MLLQKILVQFSVPTSSSLQSLVSQVPGRSDAFFGILEHLHTHTNKLTPKPIRKNEQNSFKSTSKTDFGNYIIGL